MLKHTHTAFKAVFLTVAVLFSNVSGFSTSNFTETGECQGDQMCLYDYTVEQQYFSTDGLQNNSIRAEIGLICDSVGIYNNDEAVMYCMTIRDIELQGTMFQDEDDTEQALEYREQHLLQTLAGQFCFVQTSDGKIPSVYYAETQSDDTVNFKKTISAAFQANFKGTEVEEEIDPQSKHKSHYKMMSSEQQLEDGTVKMHRSINDDDIIAYTTGAPKRDLKLTKEEDIEYQGGKLQHSAGNTSVKVSKTADTEFEDDQETHSFSRLYSASGSYSLDLMHCLPIARQEYSRHRRSISDKMERSKMAESLEAKYNQTKTEIEEMETLHQKIPSVADILVQLRNTESRKRTKIVDAIQSLLELESKHGPLVGFSSALSDVLEYFSNIQDSTDPVDEDMRGIVYSLLAAEGSFQSQMVLLDALDGYALSDEEKISLINEIAMIKKPHLDFVFLLKEYFNTVKNNTNFAEPLLLSFGALAAGAPLEVEEFIVGSLLELEANVKAGEETTNLQFPLILAMGNTGSKLLISSLLSYLDSPITDIQIVSIQALRKVIFEEKVLDKLELIVFEQNDAELLAAVIEVLVTGLEYSSNFDTEHFDAHNEYLSHHQILTTLVLAIRETNITEFEAVVQAFLKDIGGEQAYSLLLNYFHPVSKRGTDWDQDRSTYNLVASLSGRRSDVNTYQRHRSYIWEKRLGIDEANIEIAAGVFSGISNDCDNIKAYGKAVAKANLLSRSYTFANIEVELKKTRTNLQGHVYVNAGGSTLVNSRRNQPLSSLQCYNRGQRFYERRFRIFRFSYSVFVYVGTIRFRVEMHATFSAGYDARLCGQTANTELVTASAGLTPRVGATVGGGVSVNLLSVARGGISATASFVYQIEPRVEAEACRRDCSFQSQICANLYDSWPGNRLDIETWYQTRTLRTCGGWIRYPCIKWGRRRRWDDFSWSWSLGGRRRQTLYSSCNGNNYPQCPRVTG